MTAPCGCPVPHVPPGGCLHCPATPGQIELPADLYDPAEMPCPWCQPDAYPDGFPGVKAAGADHWLIPPHDHEETA